MTKEHIPRSLFSLRGCVYGIGWDRSVTDCLPMRRGFVSVRKLKKASRALNIPSEFDN
jgi:hypothetical protein